MDKREADNLIYSAFAAGVEWAGVDLKTGRPLIGCDPSSDAATAAYNRICAAFVTDYKVMNAALFDHIMRESPPESERWDIVPAQLGGIEVAH